MQFVPLWDVILDSLKMHRLAPEVIGKWTWLLACAQRHDRENGTLPDLETLSFWLRIGQDEVGKWINELVTVKLVDRQGKTCAIHDWHHWRASKDPKAKERMQRWRDRQKNGQVERNVTRNVTTRVTCDVTEPLRRVTPPRRRIREGELEKAGIRATDSAASEPPPAAAAAEFSSHAEENAADWREAMNVLRAQSKTASLAALIESSRDPKLKQLDGWRALVASHHVQRPGKTIPGTIAGFLKYAAQANAGDLDTIENPRKKPEPATNGAGNGEYMPTLSQRIEAEEKTKKPPDAAELAWMRNRFKELKAKGHLNVADAAEFKSLGDELAKHKKGAKP